MSKFFINRPIVAMVISIVLVIVGGITILSLPVAQFPSIAPPEIQIVATYIGADAQTFEQSVATPIEQQMNGVDNMNYMYSLNATGNSNTSLIVNFDAKTDPNTDYILAQSRETLAASQLPVDVTNYGVTRSKVGNRSSHADRGVFAAWDLRRQVLGELRLHQSCRSDPTLARYRQRSGVRLRSIRDALVGKTRHLGEAGNHRPGNRQRHSSAKHREPRG